MFDGTKEALLQELEQYHEAIALYKQASFEKALDLFQALEKQETKTNDAVYKIYCERCLHYIETPPIAFNGVFVHTSKG